MTGDPRPALAAALHGRVRAEQALEALLPDPGSVLLTRYGDGRVTAEVVVRTRTGRLLTEADLDALAAQAERGYTPVVDPDTGHRTWHPVPPDGEGE